MNLAEHLHELTTVALLGTDRREPPAPHHIEVASIADLVADAARSSASQRLLAQVAACTVGRRAGLLPHAAVPLVAPPAPDPRPETPPAATSTWHHIIDRWPVLEDEWLLAIIGRGIRLAPELVPAVLARHRSDRVRHTRALQAAGPLGDWMIDWSPRLACTARPSSGAGGQARAAATAELPELPQLVELEPLLGASAVTIDELLQRRLSSATWGSAHRAVLVNFVARVHHSHLAPIADALDAVDPISPSVGIAIALTDLARLRHHMLTELESS